MIIDWDPKQSLSEEQTMQVLAIIEQGFRGKFRHVGLTTEETIQILSAMTQNESSSVNKKFGLYLESDRVLGVCILYLPTGPKRSESFSQYWAHYPFYRRIRTSKLQVILDNSSVHLKKSEAYVSMIAVSEQARGKGVGKKLLDWADHTAKHLGFSAITLFVVASNPAKSLYERQGYVEDKKRSETGYIVGPIVYFLMGEIGSYFMVKSLN
jgi:ribosomal protein S18 acetylase RimI-like enzyme